jgi:hypothetical protein
MTFPALVPSVRIYTPGDIPSTRQVALSGVDNAYRQGNRRTKQGLTLTFNNITEANLLLIRSHYISVDGTYSVFYLPPEIWSGYDIPPVPLLSDYAWRYAGPPIVTDGSCDLWSIEVELVTYAVNTGDVIYDAGGSSATPARTYVLNAGEASTMPARDYVINSGASA